MKMKRIILRHTILQDAVRGLWKISLGMLLFFALLLYIGRDEHELLGYMANWLMLMLAFAFSVGTEIAVTRYVQLGFAGGVTRHDITVALLQAEAVLSAGCASILTIYEYGLARALAIPFGLLRTSGVHWQWGLGMLVCEWLMFFLSTTCVWLISFLGFGLILRRQNLVLAAAAGGLLMLGLLGLVWVNPLRWLLLLAGESGVLITLLVIVAILMTGLLVLAILQVWRRIDLQQLVQKQ
jgi:hypothetical protein